VSKGRQDFRFKFELYTDVALTCGLPEHRLRRGDIIKPIDHHIGPDGTGGYSIEVSNAVGDTIAVTTAPVPPSKPSAKTSCTGSLIPSPSIPRTSSFAYPIRGQIACSTKRHLSGIRLSLPLLYSRASSLKIDPLETKRFLNRTGFKPIDTQRRRTPRSSLRCTIGYL
jgi:hypothetical protein